MVRIGFAIAPQPDSSSAFLEAADGRRERRREEGRTCASMSSKERATGLVCAQIERKKEREREREDQPL
jgi:hypothetical protein